MPETETRSSADLSQSRAVLIGTSEYTYLPPVPAALNSLNSMYGLLTGPLCGWPAESVTRIHNEPRPGDLPDLLMEQYLGATEVALFYYVGHGQPDLVDRLCLGLTDTRSEATRRRTTSLAFEHVRDALHVSPAKIKIVILDCCYAGLGLVGDHTLGSTDMLEAIRVTGAYSVGAAGEYQMAWFETDPNNPTPHTYFTKHLVQIVENGIADHPPVLTLDAVIDHAIERLASAGKPIPVRRNRDFGAQFQFARNAAPHAQPDSRIRVGALIGGRYRLVEQLSADDAFRRVWRAHDEAMGVDVRVHDLRMNDFDDGAELRQWLDKVERLTHATTALRDSAGVLAPYHFVVEVANAITWIVSRFYPGDSLQSHLWRYTPLPAKTYESIASSLLRGLDAIHTAGMIHGRVCPANILMTDGGDALLTDFGPSGGTDPDDFTGDEFFDYAAPERLRGGDRDAAGDVFALGAVLYHLTEGLAPFGRFGHNRSNATLVLDELVGPVMGAGRLAPLISRLLNMDPQSRPTTSEALELLAESLEPSAPDSEEIVDEADGYPTREEVWTIDELRRLVVSGLPSIRCVASMMDVLSAEAGRAFSTTEMVDRLGVEQPILRGALSGLTRHINAHYGHWRWPMYQAGYDGEYSYAVDEVIAERWKRARSG